MNVHSKKDSAFIQRLPETPTTSLGRVLMRVVQHVSNFSEFQPIFFLECNKYVYVLSLNM